MFNCNINIMKHCVLFFSIIFLSLVSFAQKTRHQPAKVLLQNGDSLNGFISNASLGRVHNTIKFKQTENEDFKTLKAEEVSGFALADGDVYESRKVKYDGESQLTGKLTVYKEPQQWTEETIFVRLLAKGPVSLFDFEDGNGRNHFFLSKGADIVELLNREFYSEQMQTRTNKKYIGQLRSAFLDCSNSLVNDNLRYERNALVSIFNQYYVCIGVKPATKRKSENTLRVGLSVDYYAEKRDYNNSSMKYEESDQGFTPGVSFEIRSTKPYKKFSLYNELRYRQYESPGENGASAYVAHESSLELLALPRFNYHTQKQLKYFWNAGLTFSYVFSRTSELFGAETVEEKGVFGAVGLVAGAGVYVLSKKKIDLSLECRGKYGCPDAFNFSSSFSSIGLVVNVVPKFKG